jgi:uncharacterized protein YggE
MKKLLILSIAFFSFGFLSAQTPTLKVKGEATVKAVPENLNVSIPLNAKEISYEATSDELMRTFNALKKALVKAGIEEEEIKSNSLRIDPEYQYMKGERNLIGYMGSINVSLQVAHNQNNMNAIVNTLKDEQFNFGYSLSFSLSEEQKDSLLEEALNQAIEDGKRKAEIMSSALEVKLLTLLEVNYNYLTGGPDPFQPIMRAEMYDMKANVAEEISLNPSELEIRKEVGLIWQVGK